MRCKAGMLGANTYGAWDISAASYVQSLDVSSEEPSPRGIAFKPDGSKMYILGYGDDEVNEYSLATAWDISTSSHVQAFSVPETFPYGLAFKPDGTRMFVAVYNSTSVNEYSLSTAWDVSTAAYDQEIDVSPSTFPVGVSFKTDGSRMYLVDVSNDEVAEYSLSTPWDVSTASLVQDLSISAQETAPIGLAFKPDGTRMYVAGSENQHVSEYHLSSAWDISTASFSKFLDVSTKDAFPSGIAFHPDGISMYVVGLATTSVYQYSLA